MPKGVLKLAAKSRTREPKLVMDDWLDLALKNYYVDRRPLWGKPRPVEKGWTPSALGEPNDRLLVAGLLGYRGDPITEKLQRIFRMGNAVEDMWRERYEALGILESANKWLPKVKGMPLTISGKYDMVIRHMYEPTRRFVVEVKSMAPEIYYMFPQPSMDPDKNYSDLTNLSGQAGDRARKYLAQLQVYLHVLGMAEGILLIEDKGHQTYKNYFVTHNPQFIDGLFEKLAGIQTEYWAKGLLPPWNGGKSNRSFFAQYKPDEVIPIEEFKQAYPQEG